MNDIQELIKRAREQVDAAVPPWGWCLYPTISRFDADTPAEDEQAWTISEPYCGGDTFCGDAPGVCAQKCGGEVFRTGAEGCEEDWMPTPVARFVASAPDMIRELLDALEALNKLATQWEYAVRITRARSDGDIFYEYPDKLSGERFIKNPPLWYSRTVGESQTLVRRHKAGSWVEVSS